MNLDENINKIDKPFYKEIVKKIYPLGFKHEAIIILKDAIPLILSTVCQQLFTMISLFFCGHVGTNELAAVALGNTFVNVFIFTPIVGLATASDTLMPQLYGSKDKKKVGTILQKGCLISLLVSFFSIGLLFNSKNLIIFILDDVEVIRLADLFLKILSPSALFISISIVVTKYLQIQKITYPVLTIGIIANIINAVLQAIFVFGLNLSVVGCSISIIISNILQLAFLIAYIIKKKIYVDTWEGFSRECLYDWKIYLRLGLPGMGMVLSEWAYFEVAIIMAGILGSSSLSVMSISIQVLFLCFMIPFGIGFSGNIRCGQVLGENKPDMAVNIVKVIVTISITASLGISIFLASLSHYIPFIFTTEENLLEKARPVIRFLSICVLFDGLQILGASIIRTVGGQKFILLFNLLTFYGIGIPLGGYLLLKTHFRVMGFFFGFCVSAFTLIILLLIYIIRIDWKKAAENANNIFKNKKTPKDTQVDTVRVEGEHVKVEVKNFKRKLLKKICLFCVIFSIFLTLILIRDINPMPVHKKHEQNSTFLFNNNSLTNN